MDHKSAFQIFLELSLELKNIPSRCIAIRSSQEPELSSGYQIHVPVFELGVSMFSIQKIVDNYRLAWKEQDGKIIIYSPVES